MFFIKNPMTEYTAHVYEKCPWAIESIDAHFDDVLCNLNPKGCFIYGGVVRDLFANIKLVGDLDIIVEAHLFNEVVNALRYSSRWSLKGVTDGDNYNRPVPASEKRKTSSGCITKIATLFDKDGYEVQLITPLEYQRELTDTIPCSRIAWDIVRNVDIRCSGLMMTLVGDVYEVVPGAVSDCHNRVLSVNQLVSKDNIGNNRLHKRVSKLSDRGWINKINLSDYPIKQKTKSAVFDIF